MREKSTTSWTKEWLHAGLWYWRHRQGKYPADEIAAIKPFVQPTDICVDIGAHAGSWTLPLARLASEGRVYAFEALPHYARALRRLMQLLGLGRVEVRNEAVSNAVGAVEIAWRTKQGRKLTGNTHLATVGEMAGVECIKVPATTLDHWLTTVECKDGGRIAFVKIDVEGAEILVLSGAVGLLKRHRPVLFIEIVASCCARYGYAPEKLFELFDELHYRPYCVTIIGSRVLLQPTDAKIYPGKGDVLLIPSECSLPPTLELDAVKREV